MNDIDFVFFDIGGTLGERNGTTGEFTPFPSSAGMLKALRDQVGLRIGIISNLGSLTNDEGLALLEHAGLSEFLAPNSFVSEHDAGASKPRVEIFRFAAHKVGVDPNRCLFVGENLVEVIGAMAAGMKAVLKPCPPGRDLPS